MKGPTPAWSANRLLSTGGSPSLIAPMTSSERRRHASLGIAGLALLLPLLFVLATSFVVTPEDIESGRVVLTPTCTYRRIFGRPCPTCGLTRGFSALSHGRWDDASRYNFLSIPMYGLFWLGAAASALVAARSTIRWRRAVAAEHSRSRPAHPSGCMHPEASS